jgi:hypothetical protein
LISERTNGRLTTAKKIGQIGSSVAKTAFVHTLS